VVGVDHFNGSQELAAPLDLERECKGNLARVGAHPYVWPMDSLHAAVMFDDNDIGLLFLDAGHGYDDVLADLTAWVPKLMHGGVLMVHDYLLPKDHPEDGFPGVAKAVDEVCGGWERIMVDVPAGAEWSSWIGIKP